MRIALMIEGQEDVGWEDWVGLAETCERHGLEALFRSDHYLSVEGETDRGSLDAWATTAALAARTERLRLGTLVSPATFRHPSVLAKMAVTVDHVSGGRVEIGIGAGWWELEHRAYGFPFPPDRERMEILAEQAEIIHRQWSGERFSFRGKHHRIDDLEALPTPVQEPHPPLIFGGRAGRTSAMLAARWGDEYNTISAGPEECRRRREVVAEAWEREGRDPETLRFSLMTGAVVGLDRREVLRRVRAVAGDDAEGFVAGNPDWVIGTVDQVVDRLGELSGAGVDRVMLQHLAHRDVEMVALLGDEVVPRVAAA
jgi:F420-dependent oxidoreductase-like protein